MVVDLGALEAGADVRFTIINSLQLNSLLHCSRRELEGSNYSLRYLGQGTAVTRQGTEKAGDGKFEALTTDTTCRGIQSELTI